MSGNGWPGIDSDVRVGIDEPRDDDLAIEMMDFRSVRDRDLPPLAERDDLPIPDDEVRVGDLAARNGQDRGAFRAEGEQRNKGKYTGWDDERHRSHGSLRMMFPPKIKHH
jgi:hypothetical protein